MAEISVIVPVYKVEAYLSRCVDSILSQTFRDFTLILVDDGSPDNCGKICEAYAARDSRVHVIHQKNGGLSAARNTGIEWAMKHNEGQWLAFVDSDDWVHTDYLRLLYHAAEVYQTKISACGIQRTGGEPLADISEEDPVCLQADDYYCTETVHEGMTAVAWNKLYHKSLFQKLRYPVGKLHEDEFTTYKAVYEAGWVAIVHAKLYAYYQNPQGIMRSAWNPRRMHMLEAFEQQITFARETENERFLQKAVLRYIFATHEQLNQAQKVFHKELRVKLREGLKLGAICGVFPRNAENLWAYEEAYPIKPFWWLYFQGKALLRRKEKEA